MRAPALDARWVVPKARVFASSVMQGFTDCREATRRAIIAAGGERVVFEDFVVVTSSPRDACLDGVASSDACIVVVANRGGMGKWYAPFEYIPDADASGTGQSDIYVTQILP